MPKPLHSLERRLLRTLGRRGKSSLEAAAAKAGITEDQARRTVEWLKSKGLAKVKVAERERISLMKDGLTAVKHGLPEKRLIKAFRGKKKASMQDLRKRFESQQEFNAALGQARTKEWIKIFSENGKPVVQIVKKGGATATEDLLKRLKKREMYYDELPISLKKAFNDLSRRGDYVTKKKVKIVTISITPAAKSALKSVEESKAIDNVTPEMLASGAWQGLRLRPIDVHAPAPPVYPGKKHPVKRFIDEVREIFVSLGFQEIEGPIVQPSFWNFDALFIPQDHSARDMQDTFYLSGLSLDKLEDEGAATAVAIAHEYGGSTGSKGWGYKWRLEEAKRLVLRTHTTAVTVKYLSDFKPSEAKIFSVGRVFRNEKVTFKNLVEFYQIEGIVVGKDVSLRDMMGLLSKFYQRLGIQKVKFWPTYFPYTEPSLQSVVYWEKLNRWVELCGMGIFRPEVTLPLGVANPVLAWGGGLERLIMLRYGIDDVRQLYENNLKWLRETPLCL
ncbi:MAG: phenylalanine--tRNA ligase subunit alpha [Thaumarchaeota archaeon]|nr:phenylalanine--tRNA ligase subunit alpha [Nitrososphaerota archaeon]